MHVEQNVINENMRSIKLIQHPLYALATNLIWRQMALLDNSSTWKLISWAFIDTIIEWISIYGTPECLDISSNNVNTPVRYNSLIFFMPHDINYPSVMSKINGTFLRNDSIHWIFSPKSDLIMLPLSRSWCFAGDKQTDAACNLLCDVRARWNAK